MEPFHIEVPDAELEDLRKRLELTRWAEDFANEGWEYGTNTAYLKELAAYWIGAWEEPEAITTDLRDFFRALT